ncbi:unnamed protein product [Urochloa humidicola]
MAYPEDGEEEDEEDGDWQPDEEEEEGDATDEEDERPRKKFRLDHGGHQEMAGTLHEDNAIDSKSESMSSEPADNTVTSEESTDEENSEYDV